MRKKYVWLVAVAVAVVALDQWTKYLALAGLSEAFDGGGSAVSVLYARAPEVSVVGYHFHPLPPVVVADGFLQLRYAENPGAAFGLFRDVPDPWRALLFHLVSVGAVALIAFTFSRLNGTADERFARLGLPLVLGGAVGNWIDRLARGFVIDFVEAHWRAAAWWPAFNVADVAICVGLGLMVVDSLVRKDTVEPAPAAARV